MKQRFYLLFIVFFILLSCNSPLTKESSMQRYHPQWIKPNLWISELRELSNFPYWFDDSLVAANNIRTIQQTNYFATYSKWSQKQWKDTVLDEKITYTFNPRGEIQIVKIEHYNDNVCYSTQEIKYMASSEKRGRFQPIFQTNMSKGATMLPCFLLETKNQNYIGFVDTITQKHIYLVRNEKLTNTISIDTMLHPSPLDVIVVPSFTLPKKIYSIENKVIESNVLEFQYDSFKNLIHYSHRQKSSRKEITLLYNSFGYLNGFVGEIFSDDYLIKTYQQQISLDKLGRPKVIFENTKNPKLKKITTFKYY